MNPKTILPAVFFLLTISCNNKKEPPKTEQKKPLVSDTNNNTKPTAQTPAAPLNTNEKTTTAKSMLELLQGKWQHTEDKSNYLVFEKNHRKEIAGGMDKWDDELFVLSDRCANGFDKDRELAIEKDHYISCIESDLCWYISDIDENRLTLFYMGRGNTLSYNKVK
jgi:hypothetical protein